MIYLLSKAVYALAKQPTAIVSSTLTKTVLVSNYFFRIRCEAALGLVSVGRHFDFAVDRGLNSFQCAIRKLDFLGLFHLFKLFMRYCYEPDDPNQDLFAHTYVPKPNDFSEMPEYFVRKVNTHPQQPSRVLTPAGIGECYIAYPI